MADHVQRRRRSNHWTSTADGTIYWRPHSLADRRASAYRFPQPQISPRLRRPHAIHIIAFPLGFVPHDLRALQSNHPHNNSLQQQQQQQQQQQSSTVPRLPLTKPVPKKNQLADRKRRKRIIGCRSAANRVKEPDARSGFGKFFAQFHPSSKPSPSPSETPSARTRRPSRPRTLSSCRAEDSSPEDEELMAARPLPMAEALLNNSNSQLSPSYRNSRLARPKSGAVSLVSKLPKPVAAGSGVTCSIILAEPNVFLAGFDHDGRGRRDHQGGTALLRGRLQLAVTKNVKLKAVQLKLIGRARTEWPEGIPPVKQDTFEEESLRTQVLTFFNARSEGWETEYGNQCSFSLKTAPPDSSRSVGLAAASPSAASPQISSISVATLIPTAGGGSGGGGSGGAGIPLGIATASASASDRSSYVATKETNRLSLQSVQSYAFGKDDSLVSTTQLKGYKVFYPGTYDYSFELPIDHHQLESAKLQYGSVRWELQATVDRAGAFKPNLHGAKEVSVVRVPDQLSLETTEPISISRQWEDQLHYDIVVSGKSFPIGGKIPIAFKLTPLAKVQIHKLKVYVSESIEYWTSDRRVTRRDAGRKILLLERTAGKPLDPAFASSELNVVHGGELSPTQRREARQAAAARRRGEEALRLSVGGGSTSALPMPLPLPEPADNLLGDLDLGLESYWGSTEIEANVQIPTCEMMEQNSDLRLHPDCSWRNVNVFHWIKIVLRISRADPEDPTGTRRRHFEISIDSPFTVLNCRATQTNTSLPEYTGFDARPDQTFSTSCGCPDAKRVLLSQTQPSPSRLSFAATAAVGTLASPMASLPRPPQAAHLSPRPAVDNPEPLTMSTSATPRFPPPAIRPMHLIRVPSFSPPAFEDDDAPPPIELIEPDSSLDSVLESVSVSRQALSAPFSSGPELEPAVVAQAMTPPPQYDAVIGTPSVDGLADYFSRLAGYRFDDRPGGDEDGGNEDSGDEDETVNGPARLMERSGRVNVGNPRTPGGLRRGASRSLEFARGPMMMNLTLNRMPVGFATRNNNESSANAMMNPMANRMLVRSATHSNDSTATVIVDHEGN